MESKFTLPTKEEIAMYAGIYARALVYDAEIKSEKRRLKREQDFKKWKDQLENRLERSKRLRANLKSPRTGRKM